MQTNSGAVAADVGSTAESLLSHVLSTVAGSPGTAVDVAPMGSVAANVDVKTEERSSLDGAGEAPEESRLLSATPTASCSTDSGALSIVQSKIIRSFLRPLWRPADGLPEWDDAKHDQIAEQCNDELEKQGEPRVYSAFKLQRWLGNVMYRHNKSPQSAEELVAKMPWSSMQVGIDGVAADVCSAVESLLSDVVNAVAESGDSLPPPGDEGGAALISALAGPDIESEIRSETRNSIDANVEVGASGADVMDTARRKLKMLETESGLEGSHPEPVVPAATDNSGVASSIKLNEEGVLAETQTKVIRAFTAKREGGGLSVAQSKIVRAVLRPLWQPADGRPRWNDSERARIVEMCNDELEKHGEPRVYTAFKLHTWLGNVMCRHRKSLKRAEDRAVQSGSKPHERALKHTRLGDAESKMYVAVEKFVQEAQNASRSGFLIHADRITTLPHDTAQPGLQNMYRGPENTDDGASDSAPLAVQDARWGASEAVAKDTAVDALASLASLASLANDGSLGIGTNSSLESHADDANRVEKCSTKAAGRTKKAPSNRVNEAEPAKASCDIEARSAQKDGRKPWTDLEDTLLLEAARAHGFAEGSQRGVWSPNWAAIAAHVQTRKPKQCRERFFDFTDPTIDHSPLSKEEEQILVQLVELHGTKWTNIASAMPQKNGRRPGNQLKNNWNRIMGKHKQRRRPKEQPEASPETDAAASKAQKRTQLASADPAAGRKRQRGNGTDQDVTARGREVSVVRDKKESARDNRSPHRQWPKLRDGGVSQVVKQRLRKGEQGEHYEYRCVWVGQEEADATWETEAAIESLENGPEKLVSVVLHVQLSRVLACRTSV